MSGRADGLNDVFDNSIVVKKNIDTNSGTIQRTPTEDIDIANKKYVDDLIPSGATGSFTAASGETVTVVDGIVTSINISVFLILLETDDKILMENGDNMQNG